MRDIYLINNDLQINGLLNEINGETIIFENQNSFWRMTTNWKTKRAVLNSLEYYKNNNLINYEKHDNIYKIHVLQQITFSNPTTASSLLAGTSKNGWDRWRLKSNDLLIRTIKPTFNPRKNNQIKKKQTKEKIIDMKNTKPIKIKQKNEYPYLKAFRINDNQKKKMDNWEEQGYNLSDIIRKLIDSAPEKF